MTRSIFFHPEQAARALAAQEELNARRKAMKARAGEMSVGRVLAEKRASPDAAGFAMGLRLATEHSVEDARAYGEALLRGATAAEAERNRLHNQARGRCPTTGRLLDGRTWDQMPGVRHG